MSATDDQRFDAVTSGPTFGVDTSEWRTDSSRFAPGVILAGRYRLVSLLGRGGMGEVYRADDLMLGEPVALKFLPDGVAAGDARLAQFHNELRVARQVSHKNVCRLYDLGETNGRRFLTMEYVDGEDLGSSLRRFGRMPPDKAIQIARQLCAGVAAAHERGVLHRDLKPSNVMLDGNGDVRITDFGIATAAADVGTAVVGTPQYMAPELLAGTPASIKTDVYALGLILFEVFTGKRVFEARTIDELRHLHDTQTLTTPSSLVRDLDPVVERVILRCLDKDPAKRPASALTVAAALPGADPLAAALAAGETPSPELLVAAGETEAMPLRWALSLGTGFIAILLVSIVPIIRGSLVGSVPIPIAGEALADRADQIIHKLGYTEASADHASGFGADGPYLLWAQRANPASWWSDLRGHRPSPITFWYRTSPQGLIPTTNTESAPVTPDDPPMTVPGMRELFLDAEGRLVEFHAVPPERVASTDAPTTPRWETVFEAADLDPRAFTFVPPQWTPRAFADATAAWEGPMPGRAKQRIRIEGAAFRGRVVSFRIVWPWTQPARSGVAPRSMLRRAIDALDLALWIGTMIGGVLLARRNLRLSRADRRGAARFGVAMTMASLMAHLLSAHTIASGLDVYEQIVEMLAWAAFVGGQGWVYYLAVEPYGRRFWPDALLAWVRLWSGRLRDPRVGRELLIGMIGGALSLVVVEIPKLLSVPLAGQLPQFPFGNGIWVLAGTPTLAAFWLNNAISALQNALVLAVFFLLFRLLLRRPRLAVVAGVAVLTLFINNGQVLSSNWIDSFNAVAFTVVVAFVLHRYGLIAVTMVLFVDNVVTGVPLTTDLGVWWSTPTVLTMALLIALVSFAYYAARTGEPLFGGAFAE